MLGIRQTFLFQALHGRTLTYQGLLHSGGKLAKKRRIRLLAGAQFSNDSVVVAH